MFKVMGKEINAILGAQTILIWTFVESLEPRSDRRDLLAIKVKSEIFTEKERPSCCEQLQKF